MKLAVTVIQKLFLVWLYLKWNKKIQKGQPETDVLPSYKFAVHVVCIF